MSQMSLTEILRRAVKLHQSGRLAEAESLYRQVLAVNPAQPDALHLLGVVALQVRQPDMATHLINQAITLRPIWPEAYNNLGNAHKQMMRLAEAETCYRRALEQRPSYAEGHLSLGNVLKLKGRMAEAAASYQKAITLRPEYGDAYNNLGIVWQSQGKWEEAVGAYRKAVALNPASAEAFNNLGTVLRATGRTEEAITALQQALKLRANYPEAWVNLGNAWRSQEAWNEAEGAYRRALEWRADNADALHHLGTVLLATGRVDEAIALFQQALELRPDYGEAHLHLGHAFKEKGKIHEAIAEYQRGARLGAPVEVLLAFATALYDARLLQDAILAFERGLEIRPDYPEAWLNYGNALRDAGRWNDAKAAYEGAIFLRTDYAEAHDNLGTLLKDDGKIAEALEEFRKAQQANPYLPAAYDNLIMTLHYYPESTPGMSLEEARRWDAVLGAPLRAEQRAHVNDPSPDRRLRIGYVSSDFVEHACALFSDSLLAHHDHEHFEIFCYAQVPTPDAVTERFQKFADQWQFIADMSDDVLSRRIRDDRIDILVDMNVHTRGNRLLVFARKPAPVQVSWLGYPGTSGLSTMDYRLTDPYLDPVGLGDENYAEISIRLPDTFWCYSTRGETLAVNELPALRNGYITFGSLNNFCKHNEGLLRVWARILREVEGSKLMLLGPVRDHALELFESEGVTRDRILFEAARPRSEYLKLYHLVDVGLDPFPCNGHTTSFDTLWMGVPLVTLAGNTTVARAGVMQLTHLDLKALIAHSTEEYVALAHVLADDPHKLADLRGRLRARMEKSVLMDGPRFARNVEKVYREIWRKWCAGAEGSDMRATGGAGDVWAGGELSIE